MLHRGRGGLSHSHQKEQGHSQTPIITNVQHAEANVQHRSLGETEGRNGEASKAWRRVGWFLMAFVVPFRWRRWSFRPALQVACSFVYRS